MPVITAIKPQKSRPRVNIYVDGKFGFGLDLENYLKLNLKAGQEFSSQEINDIVRAAELAKQTEKILNFAMVRPRSEREVNDWLKRKKIHESLYEDLKGKLKKFDLLDDRKFAKWWVEQRNTFRPRGVRALKSELFQKGIDRKIVDEVLSEAPIDELSVAKQMYERSKYKWTRYDEETHKQKASEFLARKGFGWEIIKKVISDVY